MQSSYVCEKPRLDYVDFLKGIAILLVFIGHRSFNLYLTEFIYWFHIPLFFFLSGYTDKMDKNISIHTVIRKRAKSLIYPYIVFGIIIIIYNTLFDYLRGNIWKEKILKRIVALIYGNYIWENNSDYIGTLWFLIALFFCAILSNILYRYFRKSNIKMLIWIAILMVAGQTCSYINKYFGFRMPWCIDVAFVGTIFYLVGFYWRNYEKKVLNVFKSWGRGIVTIGIGILTGIINSLYIRYHGEEMLRTDMLNMNYGILPLFVISASLISIGLTNIVEYFYDKHKIKGIEFLGRISLLLMIVHIYIYQFFNLLLSKFNINYWIVFFPICLTGSIILAQMIKRYLPFLYNYERVNNITGKRYE